MFFRLKISLAMCTRLTVVEIAISKEDVEFGDRLGLQQGNEKVEEVKEIYRQHEWLTEKFRKDECLAAVEEALQ
jgi:hypothetical protein